LENLFGSPGVAIGGGTSCCLADQFGGNFIFFFHFFVVVCILDVYFDIILLERLGVIDIS
jgi:hypothetical protein